MKNLRLFALGTAVVLSLSLLAGCGGDASVSGSVSDPDVSISQPDVSVPDASTEIPPVDLPQVISSLALNKTDFTLKAVGASYKLVAEVTGIENPVILWTSSDEAVATVDEKGVVTAVAAGTATITAAVEGTDMAVTCTVRCSIKAQEQPADPAPEVGPEEKPAESAKVDLAAFYATIFTDPANSPAMVAMDSEMLNAFYPGLNAISLKQKVAYMPMMTAVPCEIVMVECANAADVEAVKTIFQARIDSMVNDHMNYPMVIEAWETEAKVVANGNFVALFVISGMTNEVVADFNALF